MSVPEDINVVDLKRFSHDFKKVIGSWIVLVLIILVLVLVSTCFYSVAPEEVGVVQRFGKYLRTTNPGLRFKLPFGIETVKKVRVTRVFKEEFGFRTARSGVVSQYISHGEEMKSESQMLTGDLNALDVQWVVQYRISDPKFFIFNIYNPTSIVRKTSEAMMRLVVGNHSVDDVLTDKRAEISAKVKEKLQKVLSKYKCGLMIDEVRLKDVTPPPKVKPAFNEVNQAKQEKERMINEAWQSYNREIPKARGEAEKVIQESQGYAVERINKALGETKRFLNIYEAYKKAPDVTRRRLYLETMVTVMSRIQRKVIIDPALQNLLPLLNLEGGRIR